MGLTYSLSSVLQIPAHGWILRSGRLGHKHRDRTGCQLLPVPRAVSSRGHQPGFFIVLCPLCSRTDCLREWHSVEFDPGALIVKIMHFSPEPRETKRVTSVN